MRESPRIEVRLSANYNDKIKQLIQDIIHQMDGLTESIIYFYNYPDSRWEEFKP